MKKGRQRLYLDLVYFSSLGLQIALSIFIGLGFGVYLDREIFHTTPWLTLIFLGLGIVAGFRNLWQAIKKTEKINKGL
jgi:ATP synthase protein I